MRKRVKVFENNCEVRHDEVLVPCRCYFLQSWDAQYGVPRLGNSFVEIYC